MEEERGSRRRREGVGGGERDVVELRGRKVGGGESVVEAERGRGKRFD